MVCERALMGGYANGKSRIGALMLSRAAMETLPRRRRVSRMRVVLPAAALALVALVGAVAWYPGIQLSRAAGWIGGGQAAQVASADEAASNESSDDVSGDGPDAAGESAEAAAADGDVRAYTPGGVCLPPGDARAYTPVSFQIRNTGLIALICCNVAISSA